LWDAISTTYPAKTSGDGLKTAITRCPRLVPTAALKTASSEMAGDCDGASVRDRQKSLSVAENAKGAIKANIEHHVLNALRHQRVGSAGGAVALRCARSVLNALRHQRVGSGVTRPEGAKNGSQCSTPYGIRGLDQTRRE